MIKAEWTNKDSLDLQPTCNQLATTEGDLISRADAMGAIDDAIDADSPQWAILRTKIGFLPSAEATIGDYPNDLISRSALMEYCSNQKSKSIDNNDIARFPSAEAVQGEWIYCEDNVALCVDGYKCSKCGFFVPWDYEHRSPHFIEDYHFCPNCGAKMIKGGDNK